MTTRSRITLFLAGLLVASTAAAGTITDVRFQNTGAAQTAVPVTFGQVFAAGDVKKSDVLVGTLDGAAVPLQSDVKATYADGSVRHAIISAIVPKLGAGATGTMTLATGGTAAATAAATTAAPADLLTTGFTASVSTTIGGVKYSASADQLIKAGVKATWLAGAIANEWQVSAPLTTADGVAHPHLTARFAIRYYGAVKKARVDVTVENDWAYEPGPQNFTYDTEILVGGKSVYSKAALTHLSHARWRKVFWWGDAPAVNVQANTKYLISTKAVPNYDQTVKVSESTLNAIAASYAGANTEPMGVGLALPYMPTTGGRDDIGLFPMWAASYLLSMDQRARTATLGTADLTGSWPSHYRDRKTDKPIALQDYPYMTLMGHSGDTFNPATKQLEAFPGCAAGASCDSPNSPDTAHQANFVYLPYLLTGDYYYLEELQFWAMWNAFQDNPNYREFAKGLVSPGQVRGQAWSLRTLAEAAYITPDNDALKPLLTQILDNNLNWYNTTYVTGTGNALGVITNGYAMSYSNGTALAPWQDDFFTSAIGHVAELGFTKANGLLAWKGKFPVARMTDPATCWLDGALYNMVVQDIWSGPVYSTYAQAWKASHPAEFNAASCGSPEMLKLLSVKPGEMTGFSTYVAGYPSDMQPALAYAVDAGVPSSKTAWDLFMGRSVVPDYSNGPQFAIVPRSYVSPNRPPAAPPPSSPSAPAAPIAPVDIAPTVPGTWAKVATEGSPFKVSADTIVRYGAGTAWIYSKGSGTASNAYFGKDPVVNVAKTVEAFTPAPPAKPGKVTTPSNTKLKSLTGLTLTFFGPASLAQAKVFTGIAASTKGVIAVTDAALVPGTVYGVIVLDASGKVLDILFPITAL